MTYFNPADREGEFRNRANRATVSLTCEVRQGTRPWARVKLHDISETGFSIEWRPGMNEAQPLYIRIPGLQVLNARMRRKVIDMIGCEFTAPLYPPVYEHIVRQSQLEG